MIAKAELLREFEDARLSLRLYLSMHLHDAIDDAGMWPIDEPTLNLYDRFLNWVLEGPCFEALLSRQSHTYRYDSLANWLPSWSRSHG